MAGHQRRVVRVDYDGPDPPAKLPDHSPLPPTKPKYDKQGCRISFSTSESSSMSFSPSPSGSPPGMFDYWLDNANDGTFSNSFSPSPSFPPDDDEE